MVYKFECSLELQDCPTRYPSSQGRNLYKLPFTSQSCVRDNRLEGNVGRCGFPGAPCTIDSTGNDNCAGGAYYSRKPVCQNGACRGEPGAACVLNEDCNWGINCNQTYLAAYPGVCGGYGAYMNNSETYDGLDFGRDYCLSGHAFQDDIGYWLCAGGPPMKLTSPPPPTSTIASSKPKFSKGLIAGVSAGGGTLLAVIIIFIVCWSRRQKRSKKNPVAASVFDDYSTKAEEGKPNDNHTLPRESTSSPRPHTDTPPVGPSTDKSSFSNPMIVPSSQTFPPEIQSEVTNVPPTPSSRSYIDRNPGPSTDKSLISNPMIVSSSQNFYPEIQSDGTNIPPAPSPYTDRIPSPSTDKSLFSNPMIVSSSQNFYPEIQSEGTNIPPAPSPYTDRSPAGPSTDKSSFTSHSVVSSKQMIPPEIQSEVGPGPGNSPIRQTTSPVPPWERRMPAAPQNREIPSNTHPGFYPAAISATLKSSSSQLYDRANTNSGFYPGALLSPNRNTKSSNQLYDTTRPPSTQ